MARLLSIFDRNGFHSLNLDLLLHAAENIVEIVVCMPPHTCHYLQSSDKVHFKLLKNHCKEAVLISLQSNPGLGIGRADFPKLFQTACFQVSTYNNSLNSFRETGLYPSDINKIPDYAHSTTENISRSEAQNIDHVAGHLNNNHQTESNNDALPVQPEEE